MFSLQMYFHNKAADFESLLLKSKQNTKALQTSLEREGLPAPAVLPRQGAVLAKLWLSVFRSIFQNSFSALLNPASGLCFPAVYTDLLLWASSLAGLGFSALGLGAGYGNCRGLGSLCHTVGAALSPFYSTNIY